MNSKILQSFNLIYTSTILILLVISSSCSPVAIYQKQSIKHVEHHDIHSEYFVKDSLKMKYWMGGQGPVLLFLHGFGGDALMTWKNEMSELSKEYTVLAPDLLWFGESTAPYTPSLASQRKAIELLLKNLDIDTLSLIGQSYGGFLAIDLAQNNSAVIQKMCIANSPGMTFNRKYLDSISLKLGVDKIEDGFVFEDYKKFQLLVNISSVKDTHIPDKLMKQIYKSYFDQHHTELKQLMASLTHEPEREEVIDILKQMNIMVLWGEHDELFVLSEGKRFATSINAPLVIIENAGHAPQMDNHKQFTAEIVKFFQLK